MLCGLLEDKLGASMIQVGDDGDEYFGFGSNLIGRLSGREAATLMCSCDLLISVDNCYVDLAAAVQTPAVVLLGSIDPSLRMHSDVAVAFLHLLLLKAMLRPGRES